MQPETAAQPETGQSEAAPNDMKKKFLGAGRRDVVLLQVCEKKTAYDFGYGNKISSWNAIADDVWKMPPRNFTERFIAPRELACRRRYEDLLSKEASPGGINDDEHTVTTRKD